MVNIDIPTISKMMFEDNILLSRKRLEAISGNLVFLSNSKKATKLKMKTVKQNKDVIGIPMEFNSLSLVSKLSVLRNVMNRRNVIMLTPNNIDPLKSNFSCESSFLILEPLVAFFSVGMNFMMMIIRHMEIGIMEKNVNRQS
jgi:hypothetical protein